MLLKAKIEKWFQNYVLRSTINGKLSLCNLKEGKTIDSGEVAFAVTPLKKKYFGSIMVHSNEIFKFNIGQVVAIQIDKNIRSNVEYLHGIIKSIDRTMDNCFMINIEVVNSKTEVIHFDEKFPDVISGTVKISVGTKRLINEFWL